MIAYCRGVSAGASIHRIGAVRLRFAGLVATGVLLGMVVGTGLVLAAGGDALTGLGLPDPGLATRAALPAVRVLSQAAAVIAVGSLLLAAFLVPPQPNGYLDAGGYAAVRTARIAAGVWVLSAVFMVALLAADALGRPVTRMLDPPLLASLVFALSPVGAWALTALIALLLTGMCWAALRWATVVAAFAISLIGLMPVAVTGHSSAGGAHDLAIGSLLYHLVAAALWVGGLIALLAHLTRRGAYAGLACTRFSRLALVCWLVMAVSGVINALIRVSPAELVSTPYGLMVLGKVGGLLVVGVIGWQQRHAAVAAVIQRGSSSAIFRLGSVEILVMFITIGLAVALGRTPPPRGLTIPLSRAEVLLGYDLAGPPTPQRLLLDWRPDLVLGAAALALATCYLAAVRRLRRRGEHWPVGRTVAWLGGCATILIATSSGIGRYAMAMFSVHMGAHMLLSMVAPILLVLGGPLTLAMRALPPAPASSPPATREWLLSFSRCWLVRMATHPLMALGMYVASFYVLYHTGLYDSVAPSHWAHLIMNAHFLIMGYVFYWIIVGVDPAPHRLSYPARLGLLVAVMPFHAFFGLSLMKSDSVIGGNFYRSLALPFVPDLLADQHVAGMMAWALGELPMVVLLVTLLVQWVRSESPRPRFDEEADALDAEIDADGEADLANYRALLARPTRRAVTAPNEGTHRP
jgi:cytochrome c oxidase assembly factor CtaG/putative copper export protein